MKGIQGVNKIDVDLNTGLVFIQLNPGNSAAMRQSIGDIRIGDSGSRAANYVGYSARNAWTGSTVAARREGR